MSRRFIITVRWVVWLINGNFYRQHFPIPTLRFSQFLVTLSGSHKIRYHTPNSTIRKCSCTSSHGQTRKMLQLRNTFQQNILPQTMKICHQFCLKYPISFRSRLSAGKPLVAILLWQIGCHQRFPHLFVGAIGRLNGRPRDPPQCSSKHVVSQIASHYLLATLNCWWIGNGLGMCLGPPWA